MKDLLLEIAVRSARYSAAVGNRRVVAQPVGSPATVTTPVDAISGLSSAALFLRLWRQTGWQESGIKMLPFLLMSPVVAKIKEIVSAWVLDLLGLSLACTTGLVTSTTMANFSALAAAQTALLARSGWNIEEDGLFDAPPIRVLVGQEARVSLLKALALLGLGRSRVIPLRALPSEQTIRMRLESLV